MSDVESLDGNVALGVSPSPPPEHGSKRKREGEQPSEPSRRKSKRKKKSKRGGRSGADELDEELGLNTSIWAMDPQLLVDLVAQKVKRFESDLSIVELEERYLPRKAVRDTSDIPGTRTTDALPDFLRHCAEDGELSKAAKQPGRPHTLVVAAAGLRAADLTRALRAFETKDAKVAKLFAKHIKLKEAVESCGKTRMGIGVGTPQRIDDLIGAGALSISQLRRVVIDASHIDEKKRGILDMKEIFLPLVKLLTRKELKERYEATTSPLELIFY